MSSEEFEGPQSPVGPAQNGAMGSLAQRMQKRRKEREARTTAAFEVPGFEDIFKVELQVLGFTQISDIAMSHQRQRNDSLRNLYTAADMVLAATVGFWGVVGEDGELEAIEDADWVSLARLQYPELEAAARPRVALIRLLEGRGVVELANEWDEWNTRGNASVDQELRQDLSVTG